jgi:hypothetical protein
VTVEPDGVVYRTRDGVYWNFWEPAARYRHVQGPPRSRWLTWTAVIPDDVSAEHGWVDWLGLSRFVGLPLPIPTPSDPSGTRALRRVARSKDPMERFILIKAIRDYHGADNLDAYPREVSWAEIKRQWPRILR